MTGALLIEMTGQCMDRRRRGWAEQNVACTGCATAARDRQGGEFGFMGWLTVSRRYIAWRQGKCENERKKGRRVSGTVPVERLQNGCLFSRSSASASEAHRGCVVAVVVDLCVVVLPNMHRQSRWTVISFGPRQVRMGERRGAVHRDLSAPREGSIDKP